MSRRVWLSLVVLLVCLGSRPMSAAEEAQPSLLRPIHLFSLSWGSDAGQVGFRESPGERFGPASLAVDEDAGTVFILDTANRRIQAFSMTGEPRQATEIAEQDEGMVPSQEHRLAVPEGARDVDRGIPERLSSSLGRLRLLGPGGERRGQIVVPPMGGSLETIHFIGADRRGHLSIVTEELISGTMIARYLHQMTRTGELVAAGELPSSDFAHVDQDLALAPSGCVYQLLPLESEVVVLRWCIGTPQERAWVPPAMMWVPLAQSTAPSFTGDTAVPIFQAAQVSAQEALQRAAAFADHVFTPSASNLTPQGGFRCSISGTTRRKLVKSPEWLKPGVAQPGIPYKWGGFSGLKQATPEVTSQEDFEAGLLAGQYVGDTCTAVDPDCSGIYQGASCTLGVDCSGLISRAWSLSRHYGTGELESISCRLPSFDDMLPGDAFVKAGDHARLLVGKRGDDGKFPVIESSARDWRVSRFSYAFSDFAGYLPLRSRSVGGFFSVGDRVQALEKLNVRPCAGVSCVPAKEEPKGGLGWIKSGPQSADGYLWWEVQWDDGLSGWAIQCYVEKDAGSEVTLVRPDGLSVTPVSPSEIVVTWFDRSNNEEEFRLQRRIGANGQWTTIKLLPANTVRFSDTGLASGELYAYKVRACRGQKCSAFSDPASARTPVARKPDTPQEVSAATDRTGIRLSWRDADNLEERFEIERRTGSGSWQSRATSPKNSVSFLDSEVIPSQKYVYRMRACNASGCSGYSAEVSARAPAALSPTISRVSPSPVPGSASPQTLSVYGSNFAQNATVKLKNLTAQTTTTKAATVIDSGQLSVSASFTSTNSTWSAQVVNPDGASSNVLEFQVQAAEVRPAISSVSPPSYAASSGIQTMTINGNGFQSGATLTFDPPTGSNIGSTASKLTFVSSSQLVYQFNNGNDVGTWTVRVNNPDGQSSGTYGFTVTGVTIPAPSISSVSPSSYPASSSNQTMTINGSNFQSGATLTFDPPTGSNLNSNSAKLTFVSSSKLTYLFNNGNDVGFWTVKVNNPDGQSSFTFGFTVY